MAHLNLQTFDLFHFFSLVLVCLIINESKHYLLEGDSFASLYHEISFVFVSPYYLGSFLRLREVVIVQLLLNGISILVQLVDFNGESFLV